MILNEDNLKKLIEMIVDEMAYPASFNMEEFKSIRSYAERMRYCERHLTKLASGSGRVVFQIDDEKVLKVAKNAKGIAQNSVESEGYISNYSIAARVFDTDENDTFLEMELARKCTKSEFRKIVGFNFDFIDPYLHNRFEAGKASRYHAGGRIPKMNIPDDISAMLDENEWMYDLGELVGDYDMPLGDVTRISSYGIVKRDGQDAVVLVDFGLTQGVYDEFYGRR